MQNRAMLGEIVAETLDLLAIGTNTAVGWETPSDPIIYKLRERVDYLLRLEDNVMGECGKHDAESVEGERAKAKGPGIASGAAFAPSSEIAGVRHLQIAPLTMPPPPPPPIQQVQVTVVGAASAAPMASGTPAASGGQAPVTPRRPCHCGLRRLPQGRGVA